MANNFKNAFIGNSGSGTAISTSSGSPTALFTAGSSNSSILIELDATNTGSAAITFSAKIKDSSDSNKTYFIVKDAPIPVGSTLKIVSGQKVVLEANDVLQVFASSNTCDVVAGILQDVN